MNAFFALNLLSKYVQINYPDIQEIVLGVNKKNLAAQKLYKKAGFEKKAKNLYREKRY